MKIAVIAGYSPSLLNFRGPLLRALRDRGHEVLALAPDDDPAVPPALRRLGITFLPAPIRRSGLNPLADLAALRHLAAWLRRLKPDKVLSYTPKPVIWGSLAAHLAGIPDVYALITGLGRAFGLDHEHLSLRRRAVNLVVRLLYRLGLACCRGVLFQNPDDLALFQRLGLVRPGQPTTVTAGSGIDLEHFAPADPALPDPVEGGPVFLTLTRLLADKGLPEFVEAAAILKPKYPAVEFRVVGPAESGPGGIPRDTLAAWAARGQVAFAPAVTDVRPELRRAGVYVLASAYREGVPRSVLEALSMGRPVITTDTPGCRETVLPGRNGFLVPPRDPQALAKAMERFILDPELIAEMGAESRLLAEARFDVNQVNNQILSFMGL